MTKARDLASGAPAPSGVSTTELGYVDGVTSAIQTQLNQKPEYAAGKNAIINGDFGIWQRGTSFTAAGGNYCADRMYYNAGTTPTVSRSTFTPATAPVAGYEGQYYLTFAKGNTTADVMSVTQRIEDVRTFAGQAVTLSFWAKASEAVTNAPLTRQVFGTGGSSDVYTTYTTQSITTSWARYSMTFTMPSISGKTLGANSFVEMYFWRFTGTTNITVDIWGIQLESGSSATPFQTATGTKQGELAACQRYYQRFGADSTFQWFGTGFADSTTNAKIIVNSPVSMRIAPPSMDFSGPLALSDGVTTTAVTTPVLFISSKNVQQLNVPVASGLTQYRPYAFLGNNSSAAYVAFGAELG